MAYSFPARAGDRFHATGHIDVAFVGNDALGGGGNGLQADEQKRLIVMPETVTGQPARRAIWRAMLAPVAPSGVPQPMMTSSTSAASMPAR